LEKSSQQDTPNSYIQLEKGKDQHMPLGKGEMGKRRAHRTRKNEKEKPKGPP